MTADYETPECLDCDVFILPEVIFSDCGANVTINEAEIGWVVVGTDDLENPGHPIGGDFVYSAAALAARTDIIILVGSGTMPKPEYTLINLPLRMKKRGLKTFTVTLSVMDVTPENYEAMRAFECGQTVRIAPATIGGFVFGGPTGILCEFTAADAPKESGEGNYEHLDFEWQWQSAGAPMREPWPLTTPNVPVI